MTSEEQVRVNVSEYYTELGGTSDLATDACRVDGEVDPRVTAALEHVHPEVLGKFYGCGSPIPHDLAGKTVLDLGCGTGRDCFVCAQLVGEAGSVIGVDMTEAQLEVARKHEEWHAARFGYAKPNTRFVGSTIESLDDVPAGAVDVVISNCVVNLSADKQAVFNEVSRVLRRGGELYFSDVFCDRRLPEAAMADKQALGECLAGAMYVRDLASALEAADMVDLRVVSARRLAIGDARLRALLGDARFYSMTVRAFWFEEDLERTRESYGETATYLGTAADSPAAFDLDAEFTFPRGRPVAVDGNTAALLRQSRFARHFEVSARGSHRGPFRAAPGACEDRLLAAMDSADAAGAAGGCCGGGGSADAAPEGGGGGCCGGGGSADAAPEGGGGGCCGGGGRDAGAAAEGADGQGGCCSGGSKPDSGACGCGCGCGPDCRCTAGNRCSDACDCEKGGAAAGAPARGGGGGGCCGGKKGCC